MINWQKCVLLGIIASGFAIGMDYVNSTYDIPMIEDYLNPDGIFDVLDWFWWHKHLCFPTNCNCVLDNFKINTPKLKINHLIIFLILR